MTDPIPITDQELEEMKAAWNLPVHGAIAFPGKVTPEVAKFLQDFWSKFYGMNTDLYRLIAEVERLQSQRTEPNFDIKPLPPNRYDRF